MQWFISITNHCLNTNSPVTPSHKGYDSFFTTPNPIYVLIRREVYPLQKNGDAYEFTFPGVRVCVRRSLVKQYEMSYEIKGDTINLLRIRPKLSTYRADGSNLSSYNSPTMSFEVNEESNVSH